MKSVNKPLLLQLGAQEYTCELILENNVHIPKLDVIMLQMNQLKIAML